ncbi:TRAP transporter small permease subunit [Thiohalophilus sp.]|uniref:TRAP transporter small permease subunit n=1 Tax=Thiohalophilus sp. TaxID=3028392 RepID=UPI002ACDF3FE|nr:TRAP transporter small permease subunit [Thiohalophilus sp.]MDZ7803265.1 TRAP transporter small permease subunit [Thiohalophilus sp.]
MDKLSQFLERLSEYSGRAIAWLTGAMVCITFLVVVLRYGFDLGWIGLQEVITYLHATVFMLGAAYTLRHEGHVRVDIFYQRFGPRGKAWVNLLGTLLLLWPMCLFILLVSWDYVAVSWELLETSNEPGGLPFVYLLKSLLILMPLLLMLQGLATALQSWQVLRGQRRRDNDDEHQQEVL